MKKSTKITAAIAGALVATSLKLVAVGDAAVGHTAVAWMWPHQFLSHPVLLLDSDKAWCARANASTRTDRWACGLAMGSAIADYRIVRLPYQSWLGGLMNPN